MSSISIDPELLSKLNLTKGEYLLLLALHYNQIDRQKLENNKLIKNTKNGSVIRAKGSQIVKGEVIKYIDNDIDKLVENYRRLFKETKKPGAMGDKKALKDKLIAFLDEYPEYNNSELILRAIQNYIDTEREQGFKYLQQSHYTVSKKMADGSTVSRLATYCEEALIEPEEDSNFFTTV